MENLIQRPLYDFLEHISDGFVALDKNWRYVYVNRRGAEMLGRKPEDLIGKHIWTEFPEGIDQPFYNAYYRAMEEQIPIQIEEYYPPRDRWFENRIYPSPEGLTMFFTEITQRKKTEKTLEQERKTAQKYLDVANTIMLVIGKDQTVSLINKKGCQILGYREEEIIGKDWIDNFLPQRTRADIKDAFSRVLAGELAPFEYFENPILTKDGEEKLIAWHNTLLTDEGGNITGTLSSGIDITGRKQAEEEVRTANEKIAQHAVKLEEKVRDRTAELEQANIKLKELDRLKSMFIASMSHELRTPLNSIIGFTGIILQGMSGELTEEQRKQLSIVQKSAKHLLALISDVIDVSKIEAEKVELFLKEFDLADLLREVVESFTPAATEKGLSLSLDAPERLRVRNDERRIKQVLNNLLSNAVKFTESGGIETRVLAGEKGITITVRDTGIGIKEEDQRDLFKAFGKITYEGIPRQEGTGLGLYLSRKIANLLSGELRAESAFGKGSTFTFVFPKVS